MQFLLPFESNYNFDAKEVHYIINKHKLIELLCIKSECGIPNTDYVTKEIYSCLNELDRCCSKEDYNKYYMLLALPNLDQHPDFQVIINYFSNKK